ncbi:MAG: hypothetical protein U0414_14765 [Polyangiaceae bacterium]
MVDTTLRRPAPYRSAPRLRSAASLVFAIAAGCAGSSPPDSSSAALPSAQATVSRGATAPAPGFDLSITFHPGVSGKLGWVKLPEPRLLSMLGDKGASWVRLDGAMLRQVPDLHDLQLAQLSLEDTAIELDEPSLCGEALRAAVLKGKPKRLLLSFDSAITKSVVGCLRSLAAPRFYLTGCLYRSHRDEPCRGDDELAALAADDSVRTRVFGLASSIRLPGSLAELARFPSLEALALEPGDGAEDTPLLESLPFDDLPNVRYLDAAGENTTARLGSSEAARFLAHVETLIGEVELSTPLPAPCALTRVGLGVIDDRAIDALRACRGLRELSTDTPRLASASALTPFHALEVVHLRHLEAEDLSALATLPHLLTLEVPGARASDFSFLAGIPTLTRLDLSFAKISDLTPLSGLTNLRALDLSATSVADLAPIAGLTRMVELHVRETAVASIEVARGMRALEELSIAETPVADLTPLAGLPALARVMLYESKVTDAGPLLGLPKLTRANVSGLSLPAEQLRALEQKLGSELYR